MPDIIKTITATVFGTVVYFGCVWLAVYGITCAVIGRENARRLKEKKKAERRAIIARQHTEAILHEHILRERHKRDGKWIVVDGGECWECDVTPHREENEDGRAVDRKGQPYRLTEMRGIAEVSGE